MICCAPVLYIVTRWKKMFQSEVHSVVSSDLMEMTRLL